MYDVIIIGGGPAGLTAAAYCGRSGHSVLVLEGGAFGGQMTLTSEIENYPAFPEGISGEALSGLMRAQAEKYGAELKREKVKAISLSDKTVTTRKNTYNGKNIILAMGAVPRRLGVEGEDLYRGVGVSYCAVCDGGFFKGKTVAVVGGGDTALHDCVYLSRICEKVYLIHRRDKLRGGDSAMKKLDLPNVELVLNSNVTHIKGENGVLSALVLDSGRELNAAAVFIAVGTTPSTQLLEGQLDMENGCVLTDDNMETSVKGVYAVGDIRKKILRQIVTAAADGAVAASSICL